VEELYEDAQPNYYFIQVSVGSVGEIKSLPTSWGPHGFHFRELGRNCEEQQRSQSAVRPSFRPQEGPSLRRFLPDRRWYSRESCICLTCPLWCSTSAVLVLMQMEGTRSHQTEDRQV